MAFPAFQERLRQLFRMAKFDGGVVSKPTLVTEVTQTWRRAINYGHTVPTIAATRLTTDHVFDQDLPRTLETWDVNKVRVAAIGERGIECRRFTGTAANGGWRTMLYLEGGDSGGVGINGNGALRWGSYANAEGTSDLSLSRVAAGTLSVNTGSTTSAGSVKLKNILATGNVATGIAAKTANYTATADDGTIEVDASGAALTITLPAVTGLGGRIYVIKKTDSSANAVTVDPNASETIDGATTASLASQYSTIIIQANAAGTAWHKLASV